MLEHTKVNHSPLTIGNKSPYFQETKYKPYFCDFFGKTEIKIL